MKSKWSVLIGLLVIISMLASACATATPEVVEKVVEKEVTVVVEKAGETVEKIVEKEVTKVVEKEVEKEVVVEKLVQRDWPPIGSWPDTVVVVEEPSAEAAVSRMETGEIDVYAYQVSEPEVAAKVAESENLSAYQSFGSYNELTFNPSGPEFKNGKLNPFAVAKVREAMNWLIDRNYIAQEILGGMGVARWTALNSASSDYATLAPTVRALEAKYAYDKEKAQAAIATEMETLGATLVDGKWSYKGEPVEIKVLIRTEDERKTIGDYVSTQLEDIGFTVTRDYKTSAEASPIWMRGDPTEGGFHIYTAGWVTTQVPRTLADNFAFFYTSMGLPAPLWAAYVNTPEFYAVADRLNRSDFTSLAERTAMMQSALELSLEDSVRIWLVDQSSITPYANTVSVASDLYGGVAGSRLWGQTIRRVGEMGGTITVAMPAMLPEPWNPLGGSNWVYDMMLIRGTGDAGLMPDPYTGLVMPQRIERAEVTTLRPRSLFRTTPGPTGIPRRVSS
jgi:peptide/nickel transport system substrate-binding protein